MPLPFTCPHCGLETLVDDEFAGQRGPCAGCGKEIVVPYSLGLTTAAPADTSSVRRSHSRTVMLIVILSIASASIFFMLLLTFVFPSFRVIQDGLHKSMCRGNLQRIAHALRQYELEHGSLPPAFVPDEKGKPMHSWRVLILPQLGFQGIYDRYNFNEPWDGPNNSLLVNSMPEIYSCPADPDAIAKGETNYMVLTGPKTLFPGATSTRLADIRDDSSTTILVTESPVIGVTWLEPKDLNVPRMQFTINTGSPGELGSHHPQGINAAMADESVRFLSQLFPADYLEGMTTYQGGEDIPWEVFD